MVARVLPLLGVALLGAAGPAWAQAPLDDPAAWERLGAEPRSASALAFSGDPADPTVWSTSSGIARLDRADGTWPELFLFVSDGAVLFLGDPFTPAGPDTVLAGRNLHRSVDGGATFDRAVSPSGDGVRSVRSGGALALFPPGSPYPRRLVAGDTPVPAYSDDGGDTWAAAAAAPYLVPERAHAFRSGRALVVGLYGAALSRDGGRTYEPVPALYDTTRIRYHLTELAVLDGAVTGRPGDSAEGRALVFGTEAGRAGTHVWASDDEGATWAEVFEFEYGGYWNALAAVPASAGGGAGWAVAAENPGRVFATVDGGATWAVVGRVPEVGEQGDRTYTQAYAAEVGPDGRLYVGTVRTGPAESWAWRSRAGVAEVVRSATAGAGGPGASPEAVGVRVWPNPAATYAEAAVRLGAPGRARVEVVDVRGRVVAVAHDGPLPADAVVRLGAEALAPGVYVVRVVSGTDAASARFVVAR